MVKCLSGRLAVTSYKLTFTLFKKMLLDAGRDAELANKDIDTIMV